MEGKSPALCWAPRVVRCPKHIKPGAKQRNLMKDYEAINDHSASETVSRPPSRLDVNELVSQSLLTCSICREKFDRAAHVPKLLACRHIYCQACISKLNRGGSFFCPKCGIVLPAVESIPSDLERVALMKSRRSRTPPGRRGRPCQCEGCQEGHRAVSRCQVCSLLLCQGCTSAHATLAAFQGHTVVFLPERTPASDSVGDSAQRCSRHPEEEMKLFCWTCSEAICSKCALSSHQDHKCQELESYHEEKVLKDKAPSISVQLCDASPGVPSSAEASSRPSSVKADWDLIQARVQVHTAFSHIVLAARQREKQLMDELDSKVQEDCVPVRSGKPGMEVTLSHSQAAEADPGKTVLQHLGCPGLGQTGNLETASSLPEMGTSSLPLPAPRIKVVMERLEEVQALIRSLGSIEVKGAVTTPNDKSLPPSSPRSLSKTSSADESFSFLPVERKTADSCNSNAAVIFPCIALDASCCHNEVFVSGNGCVLSNRSPQTGSSERPIPALSAGPMCPSPMCPGPMIPKPLCSIPSGPRPTYPGDTCSSPMCPTSTCSRPTCQSLSCPIPSDSSHSYPSSMCPSPKCPSPSGPSPSGPSPQFLGAWGTQPLPQGRACYWQARLSLQPRPQVSGFCWLGEVGVATMEALLASGRLLDGGDGGFVFSVRLKACGAHIRAEVQSNGRVIIEGKLCAFDATRPLVRTLGLLVQPAEERVAAVDVEGARVLWKGKVALAEPLWPCFSVVWETDRTGADLDLTVQSGGQVVTTPALVTLIENLLK